MNMHFKTIDEIINDYYFIDFVYETLDKLRKDRLDRKSPLAGFHYIRDWFDRMSDLHMVKASFFIKNIKSIWNKESQLSSEVRQVIKYVCDNALIKTLEIYNNKAKQEAER